jgi:hypothetical protein
MTTTDTLAQARIDIHAAVAAHDDHHRRHQYALAARNRATEVLHAPDATRSQREYAGYYLDDAQAMLAAS